MRRDPRCRSNRWSPGRWGAGRLMWGIKAIFLKIFSGHSGIFFNFKQFQRWCWGSNRWSLESRGGGRLMPGIKAPESLRRVPRKYFIVPWKYLSVPRKYVFVIWTVPGFLAIFSHPLKYFLVHKEYFWCWVEGRTDGQLWKRCNLNISWRQIGTHCLKVAQ